MSFQWPQPSPCPQFGSSQYPVSAQHYLPGASSTSLCCWVSLLRQSWDTTSLQNSTRPMCIPLSPPKSPLFPLAYALRLAFLRWFQHLVIQLSLPAMVTKLWLLSWPHIDLGYTRMQPSRLFENRNSPAVQRWQSCWIQMSVLEPRRSFLLLYLVAINQQPCLITAFSSPTTLEARGEMQSNNGYTSLLPSIHTLHSYEVPTQQLRLVAVLPLPKIPTFTTTSSLSKALCRSLSR